MATKKAVKKSTKKITKKTNTSTKTKKVVTSKKVPTTKVSKKVVKKTIKDNKNLAKNTKKTAKSTTKSKKNNSLKTITIVLGIVTLILFLILITLYLTKTNNNVNSQNDFLTSIDNSTTIYVIEDMSCEVCQVDNFILGIKNNLISDLESKKLNYNQTKAQEIISQLDSIILPIYLFDEKITKREDWNLSLKEAFIEVEINDQTFYQMNPQFIPQKILIEDLVFEENTIIIGNQDAQVTIVEFSDFSLPFSAIAYGNKEIISKENIELPNSYVAPVEQIFNQFVDTGLVKFVFINIPKLDDENTLNAHIASLCANEQDSFYEYARVLFKQRDNWLNSNSIDSFIKLSSQVNSLNKEEFETCLSQSRENYLNQIEKEIELSKKLFLVGTPSYVVGNTIIPGAQDFGVFEDFIQFELLK